MSIDKISPTWERATWSWSGSCDRCSYEEEFVEASEFADVVAKMKRDGWRITKTGGQWTHLCPCCVAPARAKAGMGIVAAESGL